MITVIVEVDWDNDGLFEGGTETITGYVKKLNSRGGRPSPFGPAAPASLELLLDNDDRRFSPDNASGPLFGNILPGRRVRVTAIQVVTKTLFTGSLDTIIPAPTLDRKEAILTARDNSVRLIREFGPLYSILQANQYAGIEVNQVLNEINWDGALRDIDGGTTLDGTWWVDGQDPLQALAELVDEEQGFMFIKGDGTLRFEGRASRANAVSAASVATYSDDPAATYRYSDITYFDGIEHVYNVARAGSQTRVVPLFYKTLWTLDEKPVLTPSETRDFDVTWENPSNDLSFTSANRAANTDSGGGGGNLTSSFSWTLMNQRATRATIRVTNNHPLLAGYITLLTLDVKAREVVGKPVEVEAQDAASQAIYGKRIYPTQPRYIGDHNQALAWAQYVVSQRKAPTPMVSLEFSPVNASQEREMITRELSDLVTVVNAELQLNHKHFIEAIEHEVTGPGNLWKTRMLLSRAPLSPKTFWKIETPGYGEIEQGTVLFG